MPEENKIDYTGIQVPDIESVRKTAQQFTDWRRSMGIQTEEEKNAALKAEMQAAQQRFNNQDLWNSEDPYEVYNAYETDPAKQAEFQRNGQMVAGVGSTIATLPFTAGMMGGWTPAIVSTATGAAGGQAGAYGGQKLGQYIDDKYGTNLTPGLTFAGGLVGGTLGGGIGYKGWEGATNQYLINKAFKSGQLKWGQPTSYTAYHQSATPITKFKFPFKERWDVRTHGADPNGAFFTVGKPAGSGFLAERPYTGQFQVKVQKPLIQTGELTGPTKNGLRNAIVRRARKNGADAVFFDGIADNTLQNQQILFAMDNADIGYRGMVKSPKSLTLAERLGIPKGERSNPKALDNPQYWGYEQWNERYNAAVRAGNWEEVQRLRDLHFMSKAPNTKIIDEKGMPRHMYHGVEHTTLKGKPYRFTKYLGVNWDLEELVESGDVRNHWRLSKPNDLRMTSYHTPSYRKAFGYGQHNPTLVHDDYLNITNPFTWDEEKIHQILLNAGRKSEKIPYKEPGRFKMQMVKDENGKIMRDKSGMPIYEKGEWIPEKSGFTYPQVSDWANFAGDSKEELMKLGYDGLYIPQYYDSYGAFISPSQFKSADPITWDGKGNIIPIVKRDNFRNLDTRYNKGGKIENPDH